ncbi:MAG: response regulator [Deltaproteobacteria bacterium]|nr:response regulator [Deltaproteobacteria bacterium]MBZ0220051.1 response regulator [Deltaproteobacteria bacterium]
MQVNKTVAGKEPVEVACAGCGSRFRLWVPVESFPEWEKGVNINCVRCGARFLVKREAEAFAITPVAAEKPLPKAPEVQKEGAYDAPEENAEPQAEAGVETILLIDDDRIARDMVESALSDIGFRIVKAKNASEAITAAQKERPDLIVSDLYLKNVADPSSDMDGGELLQKMHDEGTVAPAIITTGKEILDDLLLDPRWFDLKVKGFIQKGNPFWVEELKLKVKEVLYKG